MAWVPFAIELKRTNHELRRMGVHLILPEQAGTTAVYRKLAVDAATHAAQAKDDLMRRAYQTIASCYQEMADWQEEKAAKERAKQ